MVRPKNKKSNPNPETAFCTGHSRTFIIEFTPSRAWYNGSTSASQAEDEGSIPFARTKKSNRPCVGFIFLDFIFGFLETIMVFFFYIQRIRL